MHEHRLAVARSARYVTLGPMAGVREVWFVCHGYGQLATRFLRSFGPLDDGTRLLVAVRKSARVSSQVRNHIRDRYGSFLIRLGWVGAA